MMKTIRSLTLIGGLVLAVFSMGFIFQLPSATSLWPWQDGRLSHIFIGSILAAASAAAIRVGWTGELGALSGGAINVFVIAITTAVYFFKLALHDGRTDMIVYAIISLAMAAASGASFLWSRRIPLIDRRSAPGLVRVSFGVFLTALCLAGAALILRKPIFPWDLNPDSSVIFGCIFLGDACYFLYGILHPRWQHAAGQLLSFLTYDLVLIPPFLALFGTVESDHLLSLILYMGVLIYSGAMAVYFLFVNALTRFGSTA